VPTTEATEAIPATLASAVEPVTRTLGTDDSFLRVAAWTTMVQLVGTAPDASQFARAIPVLTATLQDRQSTNRRRAAKLLGRLGGKEAVEALTGALDDAADYVRQAAADALTKLDTPEAKAVHPRLVAKQWSCILRNEGNDAVLDTDGMRMIFEGAAAQTAGQSGLSVPVSGIRPGEMLPSRRAVEGELGYSYKFGAVTLHFADYTFRVTDCGGTLAFGDKTFDLTGGKKTILVSREGTARVVSP